MLRHTRSHSRYQRQRYIARRRRRFQGWVSRFDPLTSRGLEEGGYIRILPPRPLELREAEFWRPRVLGRLSKWNGTCAHLLCRGPRFRDQRHIATAETRRLVLEAFESR